MDNNLEDKVIDICKDAGIEIGHMDLKVAIDCRLAEATLVTPNVL